MTADELDAATHRVRERVLSEGSADRLARFDLLLYEYREARDRHRLLSGPSSKEEVYSVLHRLNLLCVEVTGSTLTSFVTAPGADPGPEPAGPVPAAPEPVPPEAVVALRGTGPDPPNATGIVVHPAEGLILTCHHFTDHAPVATLPTALGDLTASLAFENPAIDAALLRVRGEGGVPAPAMGRPRRVPHLTMGESLRCYGRRAQGHLAQRRAWVSAPAVRLDHRRVEVPLAELDATLHPGFSGGPAVDDRGLLRGMAVARVIEIAGVREPEVGLIVPIVAIRDWVDSLEAAHGRRLWVDEG